ncbi:hypothetical protein ACJX0J_005646, partial [Zea mays]
ERQEISDSSNEHHWVHIIAGMPNVRFSFLLWAWQQKLRFLNTASFSIDGVEDAKPLQNTLRRGDLIDYHVLADAPQRCRLTKVRKLFSEGMEQKVQEELMGDMRQIEGFCGGALWLA